MPALRRSHVWLADALSASDLQGLARTEVEKVYQETTAEIDRAEARGRLFSLYAGKWVVRYDNNYTHEYVIKADGSVAFDRGFNPDGSTFLKKEEQNGKLVRRDGAVLALFADGRVVERLTLFNENLIVERFIRGPNYPRMPNNVGEGVREK